MCDHVQVLSQEKAQLLKEAQHARHVQALFASVSDKTKEVQLEAARVLRTVEQGQHNRPEPKRAPGAPEKRVPSASPRQQAGMVPAPRPGSAR